MEFLNIALAGIAAFGFGAIWYTVMAKPWMEVSGVDVVDGQPANASNPLPYITGLIACIVVAGMMRHVFALSGISTIGAGVMSGFGLGLFVVVPWIATCYGFAGRPLKLTLIDAVYATGGCTVIGLVLTLF